MEKYYDECTYCNNIGFVLNKIPVLEQFNPLSGFMEPFNEHIKESDNMIPCKYCNK